jgi:hypothetical protein
VWPELDLTFLGRLRRHADQQSSAGGRANAGEEILDPRREGEAVVETPQPSVSELHKQWAKLEDEQHELALAIEEARSSGADLASMRKQQATLLLQINALVAAIRDAPATTIEDFVALLDVALEHELDLAPDIALYGPADYPMTARLIRVLAAIVPGFEFNSLRRWLSPGQLEQLIGNAALSHPKVKDEPVTFIGFGER